MKNIKSIFALLALSLGIASCSNGTDDPLPVADNPLEEFNLTGSFEANGHALEIYSEQEGFTMGYNELFIRIKDLSTEDYVSDATIHWNPVMHMTDKAHSCPRSEISTTGEDTVYKGFIVFQMASNDDEYWELNLEYSFGGTTYTTTEQITVNAPSNGKRTVNVFTGTDDVKYVLAMMPLTPEVTVNDLSAVLFKMETMMDFPAVVDYTVAIDPRMPSMGNHSSPNNEDLLFDADTGIYSGKLSLTMTGYWKINLKLLNDQGDILKGEDVTEENEGSSLFFEIEF